MKKAATAGKSSSGAKKSTASNTANKSNARARTRATKRKVRQQYSPFMDLPYQQRDEDEGDEDEDQDEMRMTSSRFMITLLACALAHDHNAHRLLVPRSAPSKQHSYSSLSSAFIIRIPSPRLLSPFFWTSRAIWILVSLTRHGFPLFLVVFYCITYCYNKPSGGLALCTLRRTEVMIPWPTKPNTAENANHD